MRFISEILSRKGFSLSSYTWKRHGGAGDLAGWSGCVHLCVSILLAKDRSRNATVAVRSAPARGGATSGRSGRASGSQSPTARRAGITEAFHRYLDVGNGQGRAQVVDAAEWLDGLGYLNFLGAVERHFSINRLLPLPSRSVSTARVFAEQDGGGPRSALTLSGCGRQPGRVAGLQPSRSALHRLAEGGGLWLDERPAAALSSAIRGAPCHAEWGPERSIPLSVLALVRPLPRLEDADTTQESVTMRIDERTFLVTGAGSGLGAATAKLLIAAGARVALLDLQAEAVQAQAERLGERALALPVDVTDAQALSAAIDTILAGWGSLQGAINCAGIVGGARILGRNGPHDLAAFARIVNVNLVGSFNVLRLAAAAMAKGEAVADGERGVIINTASIAAFDGQIGQAAYAASKGGVAALTLPAARELAGQGIRVMTIAPGIFETPMMAGMTPEVRDALAASVPFPPRLGRGEEFAALVRHIIENPMLNGEVIRLDGALRMAPR